MLKAVIFDMDNTLFDLKRASTTAADVVSFVSGGEFTLHFLPLNSHNKERVRRSFTEYMGETELMDEYIWLYRTIEMMCLTEFNGMREVLAQLKSAGLKLAVLSNTDGDGVRRRLCEMDYMKYFDAVFCRGELAELKPEPAAFYVVLSALSVEPNEAVMVGDRIDNDVEGAEAVGIQAVHAWFGSNGPRAKTNCAETPEDILRLIL